VGQPIVAADPEARSATELTRIARTLSGRGRNLSGMQLGLTPAGKR
jgi:ATP-binding protein involved in chromosome partitioning